MGCNGVYISGTCFPDDNELSSVKAIQKYMYFDSLLIRFESDFQESHCLVHIDIEDLDKSISGYKKVQVGKDQEKAQSEKDSHSKNRGGKKPN